jgi:predicted acylesterase/phospholipase RssA
MEGFRQKGFVRMAKEAKTALVLSAGAMFGAYHAGVWKGLAGRFRPDMIVGASVGALTGWGIAGGCDPDELARLWLEPATGRLLHFRRQAQLLQRAEELHHAYSPGIPFGMIVAEVPSLRLRLFQANRLINEITPRHLLASCSLPLWFPPVRIGAQRFTDGGVRSTLPIWAAVQMGATRVLAVDCMPAGRQGWYRWPASILLPDRTSTPGGVDVTILRPSRPLGGLRDILFWKRENIARWIELGERDAAGLF